MRDAATKQANDKGLLWLEHINIVVGDRQEAERFYFEEGLGCYRDPAKPGGPGTSGTMWANLGNQQFHLAQEEDDDPRQVVRGSYRIMPARCGESGYETGKVLRRPTT